MAGPKFQGLADLDSRTKQDSKAKLDDPNHDRYFQVRDGTIINQRFLFLEIAIHGRGVIQAWCCTVTGQLRKFVETHVQCFPTPHVKVRDDLKRFLDSMMSKSGKLRSLIRELRTSYVGDDSAMQTLFFHKIGMTLEMSCIYGKCVLWLNTLLLTTIQKMISQLTSTHCVSGIFQPWKLASERSMRHMIPATKQWPGGKLTSSDRKSFLFQHIFCPVHSNIFSYDTFQSLHVIQRF